MNAKGEFRLHTCFFWLLVITESLLADANVDRHHHPHFAVKRTEGQERGGQDVSQAALLLC